MVSGVYHLADEVFIDLGRDSASEVGKHFFDNNGIRQLVFPFLDTFLHFLNVFRQFIPESLSHKQKQFVCTVFLRIPNGLLRP